MRRRAEALCTCVGNSRTLAVYLFFVLCLFLVGIFMLPSNGTFDSHKYMCTVHSVLDRPLMVQLSSHARDRCTMEWEISATQIDGETTHKSSLGTIRLSDTCLYCAHAFHAHPVNSSAHCWRYAVNDNTYTWDDPYRAPYTIIAVSVVLMFFALPFFLAKTCVL